MAEVIYVHEEREAYSVTYGVTTEGVAASL